ncbi:hypothetical protein D3C85_954970 [compost metagenome]
MLDLAGELALQGVHGAAGGLLAGGLDQIGDGLGLGQVQLVVEEGAFAELAGTGGAYALDLQDTADQHVQDDGAAVALQLQHILAGEAVGGLEQQGYALIQGLALLVLERQIFGIAHPGQSTEHDFGDSFGGGA